MNPGLVYALSICSRYLRERTYYPVGMGIICAKTSIYLGNPSALLQDHLDSSIATFPYPIHSNAHDTLMYTSYPLSRIPCSTQSHRTSTASSSHHTQVYKDCKLSYESWQREFVEETIFRGAQRLAWGRSQLWVFSWWHGFSALVEMGSGLGWMVDFALWKGDSVLLPLDISTKKFGVSFFLADFRL